MSPEFSERSAVGENNSAARSRLSEEAVNLRQPPALGTDGRVCRNQPGAGDIPVINPGRNAGGCNFESMPAFNTGDLYKQAQSQTGRFGANDGRGGTAVAIGRSGDTCYMLTDNHVAGDHTERGINRRSVEFNNGQRYPANVEGRDRSRDLAILGVRTGADTDKVCNPARFADNPTAPGSATAFGYPQGVDRLHAHPGTVDRVGNYRQLTGRPHPSPYPGENPNRPLLNTFMHTQPGNSGGPVYNQNGQVRGVLEGAHPTRPTRESHVTPITQSEINDMLRHLRRAP